MRVVWLLIVGLISYIIGVLALFPAAPVVNHFRPQLGPVALGEVQGKLYNGVIDSVRSTDDLLPLEFSNVGWTLAPRTLLAASAGARVRFDGYGGSGQALVAYGLTGDIVVSDFTLAIQAKQLEPLLPVPIASFSGDVTADIDKIILANQLLSRFDGTLNWRNAQLESPVPTALGDVQIQVEPSGEQSHVITLTGSGGDIDMQGTVTLTLVGDFTADVLFTPSPDAPGAVLDGLRQMGRPDAQGRVRFVREGNLNRLI